MSAKVHIISDLHIGHKNMATRRGFSSVEEHDELIFSNWNKVVKKGDVVYILGDITMEKRNYEFFNNLKGYKKVVLGNHDEGTHVRTMLEYVNSVAGMVFYDKKAILTHCPIHPNEFEFRFKINIHGHIHDKVIDDPRYINVCCEQVDYTPVLLNELL